MNKKYNTPRFSRLIAAPADTPQPVLITAEIHSAIKELINHAPVNEPRIFAQWTLVCEWLDELPSPTSHTQ